jgi:hypothetical protein
MSRRASTLLFGVALLGLSAGCRSSCGDRHSWFSSTNRPDAPCHLTSGGGAMGGCYDAITGQPVPCPPGTLVPGGGVPGGTLPRPDELPFPGPADMIPAPGVPSAPPTAAPPPFGGASNNAKGEPAGKPATKN